MKQQFTAENTSTEAVTVTKETSSIDAENTVNKAANIVSLNIDDNTQNTSSKYAFLDDEECCFCVELRGGMMILSLLFIFDSLIEPFMGYLYPHHTTLQWIAVGYGILSFIGGIIGFIGICKMNLVCIKIFYYFSFINLIFQVAGSIYFIVVFMLSDKYKIFGILLALDTVFGIGIWYYLITQIQKFKNLTLKHYMELKD